MMNFSALKYFFVRLSLCSTKASLVTKVSVLDFSHRRVSINIFVKSCYMPAKSRNFLSMVCLFFLTL